MPSELTEEDKKKLLSQGLKPDDYEVSDSPAQVNNGQNSNVIRLIIFLIVAVVWLIIRAREHERRKLESKYSKSDQQRNARLKQESERIKSEESRRQEDARRKQESERIRAEEERKKQQEESRQRQQSNTNIKDEKYYCGILGLSGQVTFEEVRKQYRTLIAQYHPDTVSHLAPKFKEMAESESKSLNEAYDYFKRKFK